MTRAASGPRAAVLRALSVPAGAANNGLLKRLKRGGAIYPSRMASRIVSAKVPADLLDAVDAAAASHGFARNTYVRRVLEAATAGDLELESEGDRTARLVRARFAEDRRLLLATSESDQRARRARRRFA